MLARSAAFDDAVINGGTVATVIDVLRGGVTVAADIPFHGDPAVSVDATAAQRRSLQIVVVDETGALSPTAASDPLAPYGAELVVSSGFVLSGVAELLPLGVFRIVGAEPDGMGSVALTCVDRSIVVQEARHEVPYVIASGTNVIDATQALITAKYPSVTYAVGIPTTTRTLPLTVFEEGDKSGDPWQNARDLVAAIGMEVLFNGAGQVAIRPVPDPSTTAPVWYYQPGPENLTLSSRNALSSEGARNVAVVVGEGSGVTTPIRSSVEITDPASPLYPGSFGRRPIFLSSPLITTQAQADEAAEALLQRKAGGSELLSFTAAPHPAHEDGDVVQVTNAGLGISPIVVLSRFAMPINLRQPVSYATVARRSG